MKVDAVGLDRATTYWYRFRLRGRRRTAGRTRTAPTPSDADVPRLRMGRASPAPTCRRGWFTALPAPRRAAATSTWSLHLGDYFYEYGPGEYGRHRDVVRPHEHAAADA